MALRLMTGRWLAAGTLCAVAGCSQQGDKREPPKVDRALQQYILSTVPGDAGTEITRTHLDFEGKIHLVGYEIEPADRVALGGTVQLKMYWRSVAPLSDGWQLFTHVVDGAGRLVQNADENGPLRAPATNAQGERTQKLPPSDWEPGNVYVDEQSIEIPANVKSEYVAIAVGIWRYKHRKDADGGALEPIDMRLKVTSGPSDGQERGIVAKLRTDYRRPAPAPAPEKEPEEPAAAAPQG